MKKLLPFLLLFMSTTCFSDTPVIPGCAPDTVEKWQSKVYTEFKYRSRHPKARENTPNENLPKKVFAPPTAKIDDGIVHIWVERRGLIIDQKITQSSNSEFYDQSILNAISDSEIPPLDCSTNRIFELSFFFYK
jgi:TonB C terminal